MPRPNSRAGLARTAAALTLLVQVVPPVMAFLAGVGHTAFHRFEHAVRTQLTESLIAGLAEFPNGGFSHTHGPDEEPHAHAAPLDIALAAVGDGQEEPPAREAAPERRVDNHTPPARLTLLAPPTVATLSHPKVERADSAERSSPPLPPPRG